MEITSNLRLLILSCSQRKRPYPGLLPALERYDGPAFQVLNRFLRECPIEARLLDVYILSARYGLIPYSQPIPNYDCRMIPQRASELQPQVLAELKYILSGKQYNELFISLGKSYLRALAGYELLIPANLKLMVSTGTRGRQQAELRNWLHGGPLMSCRNWMIVAQQGRARIRGVEVVLTPEQIMEVARLALAENRKIPEYQGWYVPIAGQGVPPKWLVSQLTGLPVKAFHTSEARRVLQQLGIEVYSK